MEQRDEQRLLKNYASIANSKVLGSQSDLDANDVALPEMLAWCRQQESIVVLKSGIILCSSPGSRVVQNCKVVMLNLGLKPAAVYPATSELIALLLQNATDSLSEHSLESSVSAQQQRLRQLVREALDIGASDIHMEVRADVARIRLRKHGELFLHAEWLPDLARQIAYVAFNKETDQSATHFNPLIPQNASMPLKIGRREVRLRLASLPAHGGFDVVMRVLTTDGEKQYTLEELGYLPSQIQLIHRAIDMPYGAVLLSGPTGSGKTTTLATCMRKMSVQRKLYTIEDPVEQVVMNATQVPANTEHYDRSFASMARTVLRMDPDVIVLGEMRDEDTARVLTRAAITGHLVFSTLHTNSAVDSITRLVDLSVSNTLLASPQLLVCLINQRLMPTLCEHCAVPVTESPAHQAHLSRWEIVFQHKLQQLYARGQHCLKCHGLGIAGRKVVAEIVWIDEAGREFIQQGDLLNWKYYLKKQGWISYQQRLLGYVETGYCDPLDAEKLMGQISTPQDDLGYHYHEVVADA